MRLRGLGRSAAAVAASLVALGSAQLPAGATTVTEHQYGFSFSLPAGWSQVPLNSAMVGEFLRDAAKKAPSLAKALDSEVEQATKEHLKVLAIGPVSGGFFPNLNVSIETSPTSLTGPALLTLMKAEVKELLAGLGVKQTVVSTPALPLGSAVQASYAVPVESAGLKLVQGIQIYVVHGARLYVVTFTATTLTADQQSAHAVEATWHWT